MKSTCLAICMLCLLTISLHGQSGSLDPTFSGDGIVTRDIGAFEIGYGAVLQPDGKILVAVYTSAGINADFAVLRYLPDGSPDESFGNGGLVLADRNNSAEHAHAILLQPDGRIVVVGETQANNLYDFAALRLQPDGAPDSTFGVNGWAVTDLGSTYEFPNCVALQSDGKILVAGRMADGFNSNFAMIRYTTEGQLDHSFGDNGVVNTNIRDEDEATSMIIEPDDEIILGGFSSISASGDFTLVKYTPDGIVDKLFGTGGKVLTDLEGTNRSDYIRSMIRQPDGKIIAAGNANNENLEFTSDAGMVRYLENGDLDPTFGIGGIYIVGLGSKTDINGIALQPNGKILLTGYSDVINFEKQMLLARFLPNAGLDTTFGNQGITTVGFAGDREVANAVLVQPDSKIIITGGSGTQSNIDLNILRFIADFELTASITPLHCFGVSDATITIEASGGVAPYTYSINGVDFQASNVFTDLGPGAYTITIKDSNGDGVTGSYGPIVIDALAPNPDVHIDVTTNIITVLVNSGGNPPYMYSVDGGATFQASNVFIDLPDGTYQVVVMDAEGCVIHTEDITINITGTADLRNTLPYSVTPNPTTGWIQLDLRAVEVGSLLYIVSDMTGREVYHASLIEGSRSMVNIDLSSLSNGSYLLRVFNGNRSGVKKIILSR